MLPNGLVLVAGGHDISTCQPLASAELYDPASRDLDGHGSLNTARYRAHGDLAAKRPGSLSQGELIAILFFRERGTVRPGKRDLDALAAFNAARYYHTTTLLLNGMVLAAGGQMGRGNLARARNCTTRRAGPGQLRAASTPHAMRIRRPCCQTARSWRPGGPHSSSTVWRARNLQPGERDLDGHGQPQHRTRFSHGDVAAQRHGAGGRGTCIGGVCERGTVRPGERDLDCHGQTSTPHATVTQRPCCPTAWS